SDAFIEEFGYSTPYIKAPEICVEITSPSNTKGEIEEKVQLYLAKGAHEIWVVNQDGDTTYYAHEGKLSDSREI
ncbi:MAG: Uma2 family endonuclease, partial [Candidatus Electrothrix sp. AX5]|nr:Uma2 family endonuclease [Candidatus Electrothrix sp. AX5]